MPDKFAQLAEGLDSPSSNYAAVTPSDTVDLPDVSRAIRVGTAGNLTVLRPDGTQVLFKNCAAGETIPIRVKRVMATGTTASDLVAL